VKVQPIPGGGLEARVARLEETVDKHLGFGDVTTPDSGAYVPPWEGGTSTSTNGTLDNVNGAWVKLLISNPDVPTTAYHNLDVPVGYNVNVRWLVSRIIHTGNGVPATPLGDRAAISLLRYEYDAIDANSIEMRMYAPQWFGATPVRTLAGFNWVQFDIFFIPALGTMFPG